MDFLGNKIEIDDYIVFARNPYSDMILGKVIGFTPKGIKVIRRLKNKKWDSRQFGNWNKEYEVILPYQCVKIDYKEKGENKNEKSND